MLEECPCDIIKHCDINALMAGARSELVEEVADLVVSKLVGNVAWCLAIHVQRSLVDDVGCKKFTDVQVAGPSRWIPFLSWGILPTSGGLVKRRYPEPVGGVLVVDVLDDQFANLEISTTGGQVERGSSDVERPP